MPHPVDPAAAGLKAALEHLADAVLDLECAVQHAPLATEPAAFDGGPAQAEALGAVLDRLNGTISRLRAVVGDDADG